MVSLCRKEETLHYMLDELAQGLSGPAGGAPASNGFHSSGMAGPCPYVARTR